MPDVTRRAASADEVVACISSGMRVFIHGAAATPTPLVEALSARTDLADVSLYHLHTAGPAPFAEPCCEGRFLSYSLFQDVGHTTVWGNTGGTGVANTGTGSQTAITVYGSVAAGQNVPSGNYSDTVVATVTF